MIRPKFVILNFTEKCNSRCETCQIWAIERPIDLSRDAVKRAFSSETLSQVREVYLTGGEPFLENTVIGIGTALAETHPGILIRGETNSLMPNSYIHRMKRLRDMGFSLRIGLSLNGPQEVHDKTRGVSGSYTNVIKLAQLMFDEGIPFFFVYVRAGQPEWSQNHVMEIAHKFGSSMTVGNKRSSPRYNTEFKRLNTKNGFDCIAGEYQCVIWPNGDITACDEPGIAELTVGNLYSGENVDDFRWSEVRDYVKSRGCQPCSSSCD